jgi:hypothetical protein
MAVANNTPPANRNRILPVLVDGFNLYDADLPPELRVIESHNAVTLTPEFFKAGMDRLAQFMGVHEAE